MKWVIATRARGTEFTHPGSSTKSDLSLLKILFKLVPDDGVDQILTWLLKTLFVAVRLKNKRNVEAGKKVCVALG